MFGLRPSKLCFDIGKKGEIVGNFRLFSGLLLLEIGLVGKFPISKADCLTLGLVICYLLNAGGI